MEDKLKGPYWLNRDLVEKALREGEDAGISVETFEITRRSAVGEGYCSDMYWIKVNLKNKEDRYLVAKCLPEGKVRQELVAKLRSFEREIRMLSKTLPAMYKILDKAKPGKYQPFGAKCFYSGDEPVQFIIMEDLGQAGFTVLPRQAGLSLSHCRMVMKTLGRFHAASLSLHEQRPDEMVLYNEDIFIERMKDFVDTFLKNALQSLIVEVSKWQNSDEYVQKLEKQKDVIFQRLEQLTTQEEHRFNVLNHGDLWTNNMMFRNSGGEPEDMRFLDLQLSNFTSPAIDLQYFLYNSPKDDVRELYVDLLIQDYHASFIDTLKDLGYSKKVPTLPELQTVFMEYALYGFYSTIGVLPIVLSTPEDGFDLDASITTSDSVEGTGSMFANPNYIRVMKRLLPVFVENEII